MKDLPEGYEPPYEQLWPRERLRPFWNYCITLHCDHPTNPNYRDRKPFNIAWFTPFPAWQPENSSNSWSDASAYYSLHETIAVRVPRSPAQPDLWWQPVSRLRGETQRTLLHAGEHFSADHFYTSDVGKYPSIDRASHAVDKRELPRRSRFGISTVLEFAYGGTKVDSSDELSWEVARVLIQSGWDISPLWATPEHDPYIFTPRRDQLPASPRPALGVGAALKGRYVWPKCNCGKQWPPLDCDLTQAALSKLRAANFNWPDRWGTTIQKPLGAKYLNISMETFARITHELLRTG